MKTRELEMVWDPVSERMIEVWVNSEDDDLGIDDYYDEGDVE